MSSPYNSLAASASRFSLDNRSVNSAGASSRSSNSYTLGSNSSSRSWSRGANPSGILSFQSAIDKFLPPLPEYKPSTDPRDHTNLKEAWDEMVRKRCLTPQATAVLPTYLPISFVNVKSQQALQIPLPPNSPAQQGNGYCTSAATRNGHEQFGPNMLCGSSSTASYENASPGTRYLSKGTPSSWGPMHLARTVHTIIGCKEAIWDAYQDIFSDRSLAPPVVTSSRVEDIRGADNTKGLRDMFENDWLRWER